GVSELMYHPPDSVTLPTDGNEYEFIELCNNGAVVADLGGSYFADGVSYTFAPGAELSAGGRLVLVRNAAAFSNRYGAGISVFGVYTGKLSNEGEKLTLNTAGHAPWFSFSYGDDVPWPPEADGLGASLVMADYLADPNDPGTWRRSDAYMGTPGASGECARLDVVINEVLAHTDIPLEDAVELCNRTTNDMDLAGWYLSDDADVRKKYEIPSMSIPAGGYAVFYESAFNGAGAHIPFALSELGDTVFLTAADAQSNLTRYVASQAFGATENGVSLGRYPDGAGDFVALSEPTLGASNVVPLTGPVVISEIMYHPADDDEAGEYIELFNAGTNAVALFDVAHPTNTWMLGEAFDDFFFPPGIVMQPEERVLAVGTTNTAAFRVAYGLDSNVVVMGGWTGKLSNAGETISLWKPGTPEPDQVPYILVERVTYSDEAPWPTGADGAGPSLERIDATAYANTSHNWFAGPPGGSPGAAPSGGLYGPLISPEAPLAGQMFTVTVTVVSETMPTQVVVRTAINEVVMDHIMRDDGVAPDGMADDGVYSVAVSGQPDGTWIYFRFVATCTNMTYELPLAYEGYMHAPNTTMRMSWGGLRTTVSPTDEWVTHTNFGPATHSETCYLFLDAAGEALIDDITLTDVETETATVVNGDFSTYLEGTWTLQGNHSDSFREVIAAEQSNTVLHVVAQGPGDAGGTDRIVGSIFPPVTNNTPMRLTFRVRRTRQKNADWMWVVAGGEPAPEVVINEIMYHPDPPSGEEEDYEYIELYNPGLMSQSLSNWMIEGVGNMTFPNTAVLGAGAYLVCAADGDTIRTTYGITNVLGNWAGELRNGGERLRLKNGYGRVVDEVEYADRAPWPTAPDGYGPSLERINPMAPGTTAMNWSVSTGATNWQRIAWTQRVNTASTHLYLWLDYDGKCRLDDVSVRQTGGGPELMTNGTFESGRGGWELLGNHQRSRIEPDTGHGGTQALMMAGATVRSIIGYEAVVSYGDGFTNTVKSHTLSTISGTDYEVSFWIKPEGAGRNLCAQLYATEHRFPTGVAGTPGASNACGVSQTMMAITDVRPQYSVCETGTPNVVRARVTGEAVDVRLMYRAFSSNGYEFTDVHYSSVAMRDDGIAPDAVADDGEYAAAAPAVNTNLTFVRYHVVATGANGITRRMPCWGDPDGDYAFWVESQPVQTHLPNWHILSDGGPEYYPVAARCCAVSPDGQTFTDALVRQRGNSGWYVDKLRTGIALRMHRGNPLHTWFGAVSDGINFRTRRNDIPWFYRRFIHEYLAYELQRTLGLPTPRVRHACVWINGEPSITLELEAPDESFAQDHDIPSSDLVMRGGWSGLRPIAGNESLNNIVDVVSNLDVAVGAGITDAIRTNLCLETMKYSLGLLSACGNGDQYFIFNMFQHRSGQDGRWGQYPWDVDNSFSHDWALSQTLYMPELHPYYQSPLHPNMWVGGTFSLQATKRMFYPESGVDSIYTLPYRYRQQRTLWRLYQTLFTTNYIHPRLEALFNALEPAFIQVNAPTNVLREQINTNKHFIGVRQNYLFNKTWSDKMTNIWADTGYTTTNVVINEIMYKSDGFGGEFLELYNPGTQHIDLGWWTLSCGDEIYHLPHGTMLGPTSLLVIADTQSTLTNAYSELHAGSDMIQRYVYSPIWDWPVVWTSANEYATRIVQIPALSLPDDGAVIRLQDWCGNLIDEVAYSNGLPWPDGAGCSLELIDPAWDNGTGTAWRANAFVGTPGSENAAFGDKDDDGMTDAWEMAIVNASEGTLPDVYAVLPDDDFDGDGRDNLQEFIAGTDPVTTDGEQTALSVLAGAPSPRIRMNTIATTGTVYRLYATRDYSLQQSEHIHMPAWSNIPTFTRRTGTGAPLVYTNAFTNAVEHFRAVIDLTPVRP
ncbi:MAG: hypothetical protein EOM20_12915, partial [Spartobacteria bacterium]|nr:hypothetical protein [Spartobacteria bacterium]